VRAELDLRFSSSELSGGIEMKTNLLRKMLLGLVMTSLALLPMLSLPRVAEAKARRSVVVLRSAARPATNNSAVFDLGEEFTNCTVFLSVTAASGTSPTLDGKLQDSPDGILFFDVGSGTGAGTGNFVQKTAASTEVKDLTVRQIGRYVRFVSTIGGTTPSFTYSVHVIVS
jgi:hypothetical protein